MIKTELIWFTLEEKMPEAGRDCLVECEPMSFPKPLEAKMILYYGINPYVGAVRKTVGFYIIDIDGYAFEYDKKYIKLWAELPEVKEDYIDPFVKDLMKASKNPIDITKAHYKS